MIFKYSKSNASYFRRNSWLFRAFWGNFIWNNILLIFRCNFAMPIVSICVIFRTIIRSSQKFIANLWTLLCSSRKCTANFQVVICSSPNFVNFLVYIGSVYHLRFHKFNWLQVREYSLCKASITTAKFCFTTWINCCSKLTSLLSN